MALCIRVIVAKYVLLGSLSAPTLLCFDEKNIIRGPQIDMLGPEIMKNDLLVRFGLPEGSKITLVHCISSHFGDFDLILELQNDLKSVQNRC